MYVDGRVAGFASRRDTDGSYLTAPGLFLGTWYDLNRFFRGDLDEVRIYNRALSREDIRAAMVIGAPPPPCNAADLFEPTGVLNSDDVIAFVNAFNGNNLELADIFPTANPDGVLNSDDVIEFVNQFNAGCP